MISQVIMYKKSSSRYELMIRLTHKGKRQYKSLKSGITIDEWNYDKQKLKGVRPADNEKYRTYLKNKKYIKDIEEKYINQINELLFLKKPFSMDKVFYLVENPPQMNRTVFEVYQELVDKLHDDSDFGSRDIAKNIFKKFKDWHPRDLMFNELDDVLLLLYKKHLLKNLAKSSTSIHLRGLRTLYNYAIDKKIAFNNDYPFANKEIMRGLNIGHNSRALTKAEVDSIREYRSKVEVGSKTWHAINYFIFSYVGRGMNFVDMAHLKWDNYKNSKIIFVRQKTESKTGNELRFGVTEEIANMLKWYKQHWRQQRQLSNPYIFPILNGFHNTVERRHNRIIKMRKMVNKEMKSVGEELELPIKVTNYVSRHTFASVAKNELNVPIPMISEMLGHKDLATTQIYLKQFDDDVKDNAVIGL